MTEGGMKRPLKWWRMWFPAIATQNVSVEQKKNYFRQHTVKDNYNEYANISN